MINQHDIRGVSEAPDDSRPSTSYHTGGLKARLQEMRSRQGIPEDPSIVSDLSREAAKDNEQVDNLFDSACLTGQ